jgi:hypothetical protein
MQLLREAAERGWPVETLRFTAAATPTTVSAGLTSFGPQTLDSAIEYCRRLLTFEPTARARMGPALLPRVQALADTAISLASDWDGDDEI